MKQLLSRLGVGLVLGAVGGYGVTWWSAAAPRREAEARARRADALRQTTRLVPLVVAAEDLRAGTELTRDMLAQRSVPESLVTAATVRPEEAEATLGKHLLLPLASGDPLLTTHFAETYTPEEARAYCDYLRQVRTESPREGGTP